MSSIKKLDLHSQIFFLEVVLVSVGRFWQRKDKWWGGVGLGSGNANGRPGLLQNLTYVLLVLPKSKIMISLISSFIDVITSSRSENL